MSDTIMELPDIDAYDGLSNGEIASAVLAWPDGSEDQLRALAALRNRAPMTGHNRPPLSEALDAETAGFRRRADEIVALAGDAVIIDDESARKLVDLIAKTKSLEDEIAAARLARTKPYRDATALINETFNTIARPLELVREGEDKRGGMRGMQTQWDNKKRAEADAERRRLQEEQRQREREAAEAARKAEEAARAGQGQVNAELVAAQAREAAERAQARAEAVRPTPIRSHLGQVSRRREITFEITDLVALATWLIGQPGLKGNVEQACRTICGGYLKNIGVDVVARGVEIPGLVTRVELGNVAVRR